MVRSLSTSNRKQAFLFLFHHKNIASDVNVNVNIHQSTLLLKRLMVVISMKKKGRNEDEEKKLINVLPLFFVGLD